MSNILIINAHHYYAFAEGKLNAALVQIANEVLTAKGHKTRVVEIDQGWHIDQEIKNHQWADVLILQTPINWMSIPWTFKKYMDEVYTAGMGGDLCAGDGRTATAPKANYGTGGTLTGKKYLLSVTLNAPEEAFNHPKEFLFQGKSLDDLLFPLHMNFRFFGMTPLASFACYDVMKNPQITQNFEDFRKHLETNIPE